jgi:hypothetical protein
VDAAPLALEDGELAAAHERAEFPDTILEWNAFVGDSMVRYAISPGNSARIAAVVQAAVHDVVSGVERHYATIVVGDLSQVSIKHPDATRAAVAQAAHDTLLNINFVPPLSAAQKADLTARADAALATSVSGILATGGGAKRQAFVNDGLNWGKAVAVQVVAARSADKWNAASPAYTVNLTPPNWRPVPGNPPTAPTNRQVPFVTPYSADNATLRAKFKTPGPPAYGSQTYLDQLTETIVYGAADSAVRTADQTHIARFWDGNPTYIWNGIARQLIVRDGLSLSDEARVLALLNISMFDAQIAIFSDKYAYNFWRPYTAARDADPASTFTTLIQTPPFPEYPAGHAETDGAAVQPLIAFFGDASSFTATSNTPGTHSLDYTSLESAAVDGGLARIYGGMHFRAACEDGVAAGRALGAFVVDTLAPRTNGHHDKRNDDDDQRLR